jgi:hypothetical protein
MPGTEEDEEDETVKEIEEEEKRNPLKVLAASGE